MKDFERSLPMMLYRTLDAVLPTFREIFGRFGLTEPQWRVLRVLWQEDDKPLNDLARVTLISAPSLVGVVDRLQRAGLVTRRPSTTDRRRVHVLLSERGMGLESSVRPLVDAVYTRIESVLEPEQWEALYDGLDRIVEAYAEAPATPGHRLVEPQG